MTTLKNGMTSAVIRARRIFYWLSLPPYPRDIVIETNNKSVWELVREMNRPIEAEPELSR